MESGTGEQFLSILDLDTMTDAVSSDAFKLSKILDKTTHKI